MGMKYCSRGTVLLPLIANTPWQKSLKLILPWALGSRYLANFFTWKEKKKDSHKNSNHNVTLMRRAITCTGWYLTINKWEEVCIISGQLHLPQMMLRTAAVRMCRLPQSASLCDGQLSKRNRPILTFCWHATRLAYSTQRQFAFKHPGQA